MCAFSNSTGCDERLENVQKFYRSEKAAEITRLIRTDTAIIIYSSCTTHNQRQQTDPTNHPHKKSSISMFLPLNVMTSSACSYRPWNAYCARFNQIATHFVKPYIAI